MNKTTLYALSTKNKVKVWEIWVEELISHSLIHTLSGFEDGKKVPFVIPITEGKNIGKSNETNHYEQAVSEMESKINSKLKEGFVFNKDEMKEAGTMGLGFKEPMLAIKFDPTGKQKGSKTLKQLGLENKRGIIQRKFDGHRSIIYLNKLTQECKFFTRGGDEGYVFPHIKDSLLKSLNETIFTTQDGLNDEIYLDGELYSFSMKFNQLSGLIRKKKRDSNDLELEKNICFNLYDCYLNEGYEIRKNIIEYFKDEPNVYIVESEIINLNNDDLKEKLRQYLNEGYEGLMIRTLGIPYEHKRSKSLIKMKLVQDEEFKIIGFKESKEGNTLGSIIFKTNENKEFNATFNGTDEELKEIWLNQEKYLPLWGTVEFFEYTEDDIPRFPKCVKFRKGESMD